MKSHINTFMNYTTVIVEIEDNIYANDIPEIRKQLESISSNGTLAYEGPHTIINKHGEDLCYGWRFVVLSNQNESCIRSIIDDICEIVA